ncbi:hypothetical protein AU195_09630 [Mycobacterium sp. IS-1496]|uniref:HNH endonuclease signature motif containing protein n=1 Tax=Mycobacterium sp. IS-1496 TaxID=1772284 RepID=UPI0007416064|nr:HNH endonuclease signature motif containing protein [Mycobacterium sp. IS-1496]KUI35152.1 hypothetical protein AU195_09630 [Mycobacterium sp. IS-1496]
MSSSMASGAVVVRPIDRLEVLFDELAELTGQRNAIDGRLVEIAAEIDHDELCGMTGAKSVAHLMAWKTGSSSRNGKTIAAIAHRIAEFPQCVQALREGRLSLDQVGVIADGAGPGSDEHYAELAKSATVNQLRTAIKLEPRPEPEPAPEPQGDTDIPPEPEPVPEPRSSITKTSDEQYTHWHITMPHAEAAVFDAALQSHHDGLIAQWKHDHDTDSPGARPPFPTLGDAFNSLVEAGWDAEATRRPHGHRTTVVVHLDLTDRIAALHLGPLLSDADRRYLTCDATCEVWFERAGQPIGSGRATRLISRRLRRALEHRHPTCAVPGCGATRGLHAHHLRHWEDGGRTDLDNLVLVCPYHHRLHHQGVITITGPASRLAVTDGAGRALHSGSLARPPNQPPPTVAPYRGPTGERADWWWYPPYQPPPPTTN